MSTLEVHDDYWLLIVDGYIRRENETFELQIPSDLNNVIWMFYREIIRYFDRYNDKKFKLDDDKKIITPIGAKSNRAYNYMIFPSSNGFSTKGIHKWAIKYIRDNGYGTARSIGMTTKIKQEWISNGVGCNCWCNDADSIYWNRRFSNRISVEIVLDLERLTATYYEIKENIDKDSEDEINIIEEDIKKLKPNKIYYFALCIDSDGGGCVFESVLPKTKYIS